ncbi:MAG: non-canonical purine NTP pyrophosphatase, RdgB/HAM1 family [Candidatus Marinimicrobia bacterium]|nr:non-canonical purine NTP pyrophosphatase, RdgB/HAM1 family [Candidatus Neomarinimicrobiota bacterium]|tara:strand:- start:6167 stop:6787 length:621 start_codon:yes stop_codon:yes gene_type:complete
MKVVIGTHNRDKLKELMLAFKLEDLNIELLSLDSFPEIGDIPETGKTLEENALIKAREVNRITNLPALSDDTGLEVDALHGAPGVFTARYAGENCTYNDNVQKLLDELETVPAPNRTAKFRTVVAYVDGDFEITAEGYCDGLISGSAKGENGFGYDPVFFITNEKRTFSQMTIEEKEKYSHRGKAIRKIIKLLTPHFNNSIEKEIV